MDVHPLLGLGVSIRWAQPGPADFTPVVAVIVAIFIVRFLLGFRLTGPTVVMAVLGGTLWAAAAAQWGITVPSLVAVAAVAAAALRPAPRPR
jgi:hypothetical protein